MQKVSSKIDLSDATDVESSKGTPETTPTTVTTVDETSENLETTTITTKDGKLFIKLGTYFEPQVFNEVLEYICTEKVCWNQNTDPFHLLKVKEAAEYFKLERLSQLCRSYLNPQENIKIPPSSWLDNMKWAFENLRQGKNDMSDVYLVCRGDGKDVSIPCHSFILMNSCKYFKDKWEKELKVLYFDEIKESELLKVLKYIYCRELEIDALELPAIWFLSNEFQLSSLKLEMESIIKSNLTKQNAPFIQEIAKKLKDQKIIELCDVLLK
eukprot:gene11362-4530_t